jgi:hypothetical protein
VIETSRSLQSDRRLAPPGGGRSGGSMRSTGKAEFPHQLVSRIGFRRARRAHARQIFVEVRPDLPIPGLVDGTGIAAQMFEILVERGEGPAKGRRQAAYPVCAAGRSGACRPPIRGGYSRLEGLRPGSTGSRVAGSTAPGAGPPPGRAAAISPYPPQYRLPAEPPSTCTPQYSLGRMTTSRRTIARPLCSSTVRCPSGPILTKAVDKIRRPWASAGESARGAEAGFSAAETGSGSDPWAACAAVSGTGPGLGIAASLGGGLQAASAAIHGSKRQGITPFANLNTAFATRTAPSSHRTGRAEAAIVTKAGAGDRSDLQLTAGTHRINFVKFRAAQGIASQGEYQ